MLEYTADATDISDAVNDTPAIPTANPAVTIINAIFKMIGAKRTGVEAANMPMSNWRQRRLHPNRKWIR